jgi:hypothetical protein
MMSGLLHAKDKANHELKRLASAFFASAKGCETHQWNEGIRIFVKYAYFGYRG